jgi:hypothetical protein
MAAALNVTQPFSCGLGGDAMCLFFRADDATVHGINGRYTYGLYMSLSRTVYINHLICSNTWKQIALCNTEYNILILALKIIIWKDVNARRRKKNEPH